MNAFSPIRLAVPAAPQRGRTLIELMVAIALGLLILLGVGGLYLASQQSTRTAAGLGSSDNVGNVALGLIGASIRRAGYAEIAGAFTSLPTGGEARLASLLYQGRSLAGCSTARFGSDNPNNSCGTTATGNPDAIGVWFQADNALASSQGATANCVGSSLLTANVPAQFQGLMGTVTTINVVRNSFYVTNNTLHCSDGANAGQPLLSGVEDLKVFYGFDDTAYANPAADMDPVSRTMRTADDINGMTRPVPGTATALSAWDYVVSATVCVLVRTEEQGVSAQGASVTYRGCPQSVAQVLDPSSTPETTASDGRIRRAQMQTFAVRGRARPQPL
jgi:type IV pilus assembly protein PilW